LSGSPPDRATVRPPSGLLGMLVLIVAVEAIITGRRADLVSALLEDWRVAALAAETKSKGRDVLCFGDSLVKYGVLPKVIEARSGLRAYNLATSGGTAPSAYFLLRRALDSGARPKAVVVDFNALMLPRDDPPNLLNYPELGSVRDCLDLGFTSGDPGFAGALALSKLLPSYCWRFEIRRSVLASLDGRSVSQRESLRFFRDFWANEAGAHPSPSGRKRHPQEDTMIDGVSPATWAFEPTDRAYIDRFLALAEARGIAVYWLMPPMAPEVHVRRGHRGTDALYDRFARSIAAKYPNAVIVDARNSGYDDSVHIDHLHLDRRGASVLSDDLAAVLVDRPVARAPGELAWVALPALAGRTGAEPASAVARSRASTPR
jgi:hypothetical protein